MTGLKSNFLSWPRTWTVAVVIVSTGNMPLASQPPPYQPKLVVTLDKDFTSPVRFSPDGKLLAAMNRALPARARFWNRQA
jgi:hypothetical protein